MSKTPKDPNDDEKSDDYVGYGRPPKHTQFKPGHKGKGGRPKGSKRSSSIEAAFEREITVNENGKPTKVAVEEALALGALQRALNGDSKAMNSALKLLQIIEKRRPPPMSAEEREQRRLLEPAYQKFMAQVRAVWGLQNVLAWYQLGSMSDGSVRFADWVLEAAMDREEWRKVHGAPNTLPGYTRADQAPGDREPE